jgi:multidrug efflux system membrane fusion protein
MKKIVSFSLITLALISGLIYYTRFYTAPRANKNTALTINTVTVKTESMPIIWKTIGTIQPQQTVTVLPQITAKVKAIYLTAGNKVKVGDKLIGLDPSTFKIALHTAQANLKQSQAKLMALQKDLKRYKSLISSGVISQQEYDQQVFTTRAQEAQVQADKTQVEQASTQLSYTEILAPIVGKTGSIAIHIGDLVTADATPLLTINQLDPIQANFSVSQNQFSLLKDYQSKNDIKITLYTDQEHKSSSTELNFIDNAIDPNTGTILLKTLFENSKEWFWPGQSVQVEIILGTEENVKLIPSKAIGIDQQGHFVYVVKNNKAVLQPIIVNREVGDLSVISEGLVGDETVIINAPPNLQNGSVVNIV